MADFDGTRLREILRHVATPVTVVTYQDDNRPRGVTIGSFASVSLDPPLVAFNVDRDTNAHVMGESGGSIMINILSDEQATLADLFSLSDVPPDDKFAEVEYEMVDGIPAFRNASAVLQCKVTAVHEAGDSSIIVAEVIDGNANDGRVPLLYFNRSYRSVGHIREPALRVPVNRPSSSTP